jgi:YspA, cpYpsA-related SLOG family
MAEHDERVVALFTGSRDWTDVEAIRRDVDALPMHALIVHGANLNGADAIAHGLAEVRGLHVASVRARWDCYGKSAGYKRNTAMLLVQPTIVYAYPLGESPGTRMMMRLAQIKGIPVLDRSPISGTIWA